MEPHADERHQSRYDEAGDVHAADGPPSPGLTARATVNRIIDGDTIEVMLQWPVTIRLKDCWCPEPRGESRASGMLAKYHMEKIAPVGSKCVVSVDSSIADSLGDVMTFGRVVADVWPCGRSQSLSELMIESGFGAGSKQ